MHRILPLLLLAACQQDDPGQLGTPEEFVMALLEKTRAISESHHAMWEWVNDSIGPVDVTDLMEQPIYGQLRELFEPYILPDTPIDWSSRNAGDSLIGHAITLACHFAEENPWPLELETVKDAWDPPDTVRVRLRLTAPIFDEPFLLDTLLQKTAAGWRFRGLPFERPPTHENVFNFEYDPESKTWNLVRD